MSEKQLDEQEILRLAKLVNPNPLDLESIFNLYKKYVFPPATRPKMSGCMTCGNSIVIYWRKLIEWYNLNKNEFIEV